MTRNCSRRRLVLLAALGLALVACAIVAWRTFEGRRVAAAVRQLQSADPAARAAAVRRLALLRDEGDLKRLASYLGDEDERVRNGVVEALARIGAPAVKPAVDFAKSEIKIPYYYRTTAYWKLSNSIPWLREGLKTLPGLVGRPNSGEGYAPARIADAYGALLALFPRLGGAAVEPLISMGADRRDWPGLLAIECLARMGDPRSYDLLEHVARVGDPWTVVWALQGIGAIEANRAAALANPRLDAAQMEAWRLYEGKREGAISAIITCLGHKAWPVRKAAVGALRGFAQEPRVFDRLAAVVKDLKEDGVMRADAMRAAGLSGDARLPGLVEKGLTDANTRGATMEIIYRLNRDQQLDILTKTLASDSPVVRSLGLECFYTIHDETMVPPLVERSKTGSPAECLDARRALERIAGGVIMDRNDSQEVKDAKYRIQAAARDAIASVRVQDAREAPVLIESTGAEIESTEADK